ncbi:MAG TPA: DUF58 domain-containing protein [Candidatus Thermoplasmatota archaeon]|nr:DUF58 domain-containing protein [Candidatus Thermoplasmatota archaeon]
MRPTRRLVALAAATAVAGVTAVAARSWPLGVAAVPLVAALAWSILECCLPLPQRADAVLEPGGAVLRDEPFTLRVRASRVPLARNLRIEADWPAGWHVMPGSATRLRPNGAWLEATVALRSARAGTWILPGLRIARVGTLGSLSRSASYPQALAASVLPVTAGTRRIRLRPRPPSRAGLPTRIARSGPGDEFYALRDYVPGDGMGRINWKATARAGKPMTNEVLPDEPSRYVLYVDVRAAASEQEGADAVSRTLEAAGCLAESLVAARAHVGIVALARDPRFLVPLGGQAQARRAMHLLMACEPAPHAPLAPMVAAGLHLLPARSNAILLTADLYDGSLPEALLALRARHRHVDLVCVGHPEPAGTDGVPPAAAPFWRAAGAVLNADQEALLHTLRACADRVAHWRPDQPFALAIVQAGLAGAGR